jgi:hypothetical protein
LILEPILYLGGGVCKEKSMTKESKNELPKEMFAAVLKDHDQQLEAEQQLIQIAIFGYAAKLEAHCLSLREKVAEKDAVISGL